MSTPEPKHVSPARPEAGLRRANRELEELKAESPAFATLVSGRPISYELLHDYRMGAILLATSGDEGFQYVRGTT